MQRLPAKISRSTRELGRFIFDLSSIEEISLLFREPPAQDGTSTRRTYPFLESFLCRRSRIAFNGVNGGGLASRSKERRRSFPRINITSRRFFLRIFSIFRIIRFPIYDGGARKIERHSASIRPRWRKNIQIARSLPRTRNDRIMKAHFVLDRSTWWGIEKRAREERGYPPI